MNNNESYNRDDGSVDCEKFYDDVLKLHFEVKKDKRRKKEMDKLWKAIVDNQDKNICCKYILIKLVSKAWDNADEQKRQELIKSLIRPAK